MSRTKAGSGPGVYGRRVGNEHASLPVDDAEPAVVAGRHEPVANGEGALFGYERVVAKPAGDSHVLAGASVEIGDV